MAGKTKKPDLIDDEMSLAEYHEFEVAELKMKDKRWYMKMWVDKILDKTYYRYKMEMVFNKTPYEDRIHDLEQDLNDGLFGQEPKERARLGKDIGKIRDEMAKMEKECRTISFSASVEELKNKDRGTMLLLRIPDDIITALNEQKSRFSYYEIKIEPSYV